MRKEWSPLPEARIVGRWLHFDSDSLGPGLPHSPVPLHFGHGLIRKRSRGQSAVGGVENRPVNTFQVRLHKGVVQIGARSIDSHGQNPVIVYPHLQFEDNIQNSRYGSFALQSAVVISDLDMIQATAVVSRSHYLPASMRGIVVACRFKHPDKQDKVRRSEAQNRLGRDAWSDAWTTRLGGVIGVAVLDNLYHGVPSARESFVREAAKKLGKKTPKGDMTTWPRSWFVQDLGIAWGSRFAVDAPYRGIGIGEVLARRLKDVARNLRLPQANYIEVITTQIREKDKAIAWETGFLTKAGYRFAAEMKSRPIRVLDPDSGQRIAHSAAKGYYYCLI